MDKKLINFVKNAKLSKLGELFKVLAKKTTDYREKNNDSLPPKILPHALEICKNYVWMQACCTFFNIFLKRIQYFQQVYFLLFL